MKTTIDSAGRIVIPKRLRDEAGLQPGSEIDVRCRDGIIEVEPAPSKVRLERHGRFLVAVTDETGPPLTNEVVEATRLAVREERERSLLALDRQRE